MRSDGSVSLTITKVEEEDDGEYTVEAINEHGKDKKTTCLNVFGEFTCEQVLIGDMLVTLILDILSCHTNMLAKNTSTTC